MSVLSIVIGVVAVVALAAAGSLALFLADVVRPLLADPELARAEADRDSRRG